jgi:uncharacterized membrane protein YhhN
MKRFTSKDLIVIFLMLVSASIYISTFFSPNLIVSQLCRPIPHLGFIYFLHRFCTKYDAYLKWLTVGLAFCTLGDFILKIPGAFVGGLILFLIGHLFYIVAFQNGGVKKNWKMLPAFVVYSGVLYSILFSHLGEMKIPVLAYALVISFMGWSAYCRIGHLDRNRSKQIAGFAGAILFIISDSILASVLFMKSSFPFSGILIITSYYGAQIGILTSAHDSY